MFGFTIIRKKELMRIYKRGSVEFVRAYEAGYAAGRHDAVFDTFSPNQIRAACGLDPFPVESKEWKRINQLFEEATAMRKDSVDVS